MMSSKQCFAHIETLSKTGDSNSFALTVPYVDQVPPSEISQLRDKVRELPESKITSEMLDILDARAKRS